MLVRVGWAGPLCCARVGGTKQPAQSSVSTALHLKLALRVMGSLRCAIAVFTGARAAELTCPEAGSPRRCGGQGDLLTGILAVFLTWASSIRWGDREAEGDDARVLAEVPPVQAAALAASTVLRLSAHHAFSTHKRATTTPDILKCIGPAMQALAPVAVEFNE